MTTNNDRAPRTVAATGVLTTAAGIVMQIAGHVHYPTVPPAVIIAAAAVAVTVFGPWRFSAAAAGAVGVFTLVGGAAAARWRERLAGSGHLLADAGTYVQMAGGVVALVGAVAAIRIVYTRRRTAVA